MLDLASGTYFVLDPIGTRVWQLLAEGRKQYKLERVFWYTWLSTEGITASAFDYSGLRRVRAGVLIDTPALTVFRRAARQLQGCAKQVGDARRCRT